MLTPPHLCHAYRPLLPALQLVYVVSPLPSASRAASGRPFPPRLRRGLLPRLFTSELPRRLVSPPSAPPNTWFTRLPDIRLSFVSRFLLCVSFVLPHVKPTHGTHTFDASRQTTVPSADFACFHTPAHTQTHALTPQDARALLFSPRSPLRAALPTSPLVQFSFGPFPLSYTPR